MELVKVSWIEVCLRPRGQRDELIGIRDGMLQARVSAPPVNGKASKALCRLIAKVAGVAPSRVSWGRRVE
jgi:uncharacterized protein YggU (UPF0235/DUF167 family)